MLCAPSAPVRARQFCRHTRVPGAPASRVCRLPRRFTLARGSCARRPPRSHFAHLGIAPPQSTSRSRGEEGDEGGRREQLEKVTNKWDKKDKWRRIAPCSTTSTPHGTALRGVQPSCSGFTRRAGACRASSYPFAVYPIAVTAATSDRPLLNLCAFFPFFPLSFWHIGGWRGNWDIHVLSTVKK